MATFSWSDTVHIAFGSCLPCLKPSAGSGSQQGTQHGEHDNAAPNAAINRIPRARADELQGLLADPDTDVDAETLSLHSNPGGRTKRKRRTKAKGNAGARKITLFGYDLFGRPTPPPIQLPADDGDDALGSGGSADLTPPTPNTIVTAHSTASTFDLDAAPLDADAIAALSSPEAVAAAAAHAADVEAQRLREKEERRQRRRERKELRRLAEAHARGEAVGEGEAFEGFQGSGGAGAKPGYPRIPNAMFPRGPTSDSGSNASGSAFSGSGSGAGGGSGYGPFVAAPPPGPYIPNNDDDEEADLDGGMYARRTPRPAAGDRSASDSRSRTSASRSDRASAAHHAPPDPRASKSKKSGSSRTSSATTGSQSPSLPSPRSSAFSSAAQEIVSPSTDEAPVRRPRGASLAQKPPSSAAAEDTFPATRIGGGAGFPSTGFGGGGAKARDLGAFLARRGNEDEEGDQL
ncbi:hypothetical protein BJ912DRAFT_1034742 [Pholiota molesta]|nr:hypothetical protein BJ912DRAFT_1034742 [Pholiota molesta]